MIRFRLTFFLSLLLIAPALHAAPLSYSVEEMARINDSIVREGNLLYQYEKAYRMLMNKAAALEIDQVSYNTPLVYKNDEGLHALLFNYFYDSGLKLTFPDGVDGIFKTETESRELTDKEQALHNIRNKIIAQIVERNNVYQVARFKNFVMNHILIPDENGYRFYAISSPEKDSSETILYGNDFVFFADETGQIRSWKRFHANFNLVSTAGSASRENRHTHPPGEPFITATDICIFKLYGTQDGQTSFFVRSPGLEKTFEYDARENYIFVHGADHLIP